MVIPRTFARFAPVVGAAVLAACASPTLSERYRTLEHEMENASRSVSTLEDRSDPLSDAGTLDRSELVAAVLERNPTVRSAQQSWRAALARYPQVTALEDPTLAYGVAPRSFGSRSVDDAHKVALTQKLPFPGKLSLRGQAALAEAEAAQQDFEGVRVQLGTMASLLYDTYYFLTRSIEITAEHTAFLEDLKVVATARYEAGGGSQQDPLQAETELAHLVHQNVVLRSELRVTRQQINTLLHRDPDAALPAVPTQPPSAPAGLQDELPELIQNALGTRPDLLAARARVESREASVQFARREFWPDFTLTGSYNSLWQDSDLQPFVGIAINVPLQVSRRRAALREADAGLGRAESERARLEDEVRLAVSAASVRLEEAHHVVRLFEDRLLPPSRDRIVAARVGFETGRNSFLVLIEAERNLRTTELGYEEARTGLSQRSAELLRAAGLVPGMEQ